MAIDPMFGLGILSQGETITSPEQHRLIAKRAWLQLWDYLSLNDEHLLASQIPVPWSLDEDRDLKLHLDSSQAKLRRFESPEALRQYIVGSERYEDERILTALEKIPSDSRWQRMNWILNEIQAENPLSILDVGSGWGEIAFMLGVLKRNVVSLAPNPAVRRILEPKVRDAKINVRFVDKLFEEITPKEGAFDLVLLGEVIEHVLDDTETLQKACLLARRTVLLTTPVGSCEQGFHPNADWRSHDEHLRAYSRKRFEELLSKAPQFRTVGDIQVIAEIVGHRQQPLNCFCVKLRRIRDDCVQLAENGNGLRDEAEAGAVGSLR
jgi:hypothetical protein